MKYLHFFYVIWNECLLLIELYNEIIHFNVIMKWYLLMYESIAFSYVIEKNESITFSYVIEMNGCILHL